MKYYSKFKGLMVLVPNSYINIDNNDSSLIKIKPFFAGPFTIGIRGKNVCGCSNWSYKNFTVVPDPNTGGGGNINPLQF